MQTVANINNNFHMKNESIPKEYIDAAISYSLRVNSAVGHYMGKGGAVVEPIAERSSFGMCGQALQQAR